MAKIVLVRAYTILNAIDLSLFVKSVTITVGADLKDSTSMGNAADLWRTRLGGIKEWSASIEFFADHAAGNVDATLFPLVGSSFAVEFRATSAAVSATNPKFTGTGLLASLQAVGGSVGEVEMAPVTIEGSGALVRAEA